MNKQKLLEKALELACIDGCDEQCPSDFYDIDWIECKTCTATSEVHYDINRDCKCWMRYYIERAAHEVVEEDQ